MKLNRKQSTQRRHRRIRRKLSGTAERPRLAVFRSNMHIYVQAIDDTADRTVASASTLDADVKSQGLASATGDASTAVGKLVAERLKAKGIDSVIFDRGGNLYHGRVKALADAAREAGLNF